MENKINYVEENMNFKNAFSLFEIKKNSVINFIHLFNS